MKYSELIKLVASESSVSQTDAKRVLDNTMEIVKKTVKSGNEVVLNKVGKFTKKVRPSRKGINPATGESITIPESSVVNFKMAKEFKDYLNM